MAAGRTKLYGLNDQVRARASWALDVADYYGVPVTVTSGFRSLDAQRRLYDAYRLGTSKWPANRPGDSAHNFGLAFDSVVPDYLWPWWTTVRQAAGFEVLPNDVPHAQAPNWRDFVRRSRG